MLVEFCHVEENDLGKFRQEVKEAFFSRSCQGFRRSKTW